LVAEPVQLLDQQEHREGDDDEADDRVHEQALIQGHGAGRLGRHRHRTFQRHEEIRESNLISSARLK
jgi:hypothetical protein